MIRFEEVTEDVVRLANEVQTKYFPELVNVKIKYLFDLKQRTSEGKTVLGRCLKPDDLVRHFTVNEAGDEEGYQYVITLDKVAYTNIEDIDRIRILRHEQRHVLYLGDDATQPYKIYPHDIADFIVEIELNAENPRWASRVASLAENIYEQMKEQEKDKKYAAVPV